MEELIRNVKLIVEYDGNNYAGWQRQNNAVGIQQIIEEAIKSLTGESVNVIGSSRTDSGVHARGFVCNFKTGSNIPAGNFRDALNNKLPEDVVIHESQEMPLDFHSRFDAKGKRYAYTILNSKQRVAIGRHYSYQCRQELDEKLMQSAAKYFLGTHDFSAFRTMGSSVKTSVRTITELTVERRDKYITVSVSADGFLYNMVRIITGTLIDAGRGRISPEDIPGIIESKDRNRAGRCIPGKGLCLEEVFY